MSRPNPRQRRALRIKREQAATDALTRSVVAEAIPNGRGLRLSHETWGDKSFKFGGVGYGSIDPASKGAFELEQIALKRPDIFVNPDAN